jgi:multiple sugar transport system substrate-binding protein
MLILVVSLSLLAACGSIAGSAQTGGSSGSTQVSAVPAPTAGPLATAASLQTTGATAGAGGDIKKITMEDGAKLTFLVVGNPTEQQLYQDGMNRFKELFPNVTVDLQVTPNSVDTLLQAGFSAGSAPDVFLLDPPGLGAFGPQGLLLPLDSAMAQAGVQRSDYVDSLINLFTIDGKTLGIPKDFNPLVLYINTDMAKNAGVDPTSIKTWNDLQAAAPKLTSGSGAGKVYGICVNPDIQRVGAQMLQLGDPMIKGNTATFSDTNGIAAMNFWLSFLQNGSGQLYQNLGKSDCGQALATESAAMDYDGGWVVTNISDPNYGAKQFNYTAIPFPTPPGGKQATWLFTNAFGASARTKYPQAAAALVLFLTSSANQQALIPTGLAQPSLKALANDPYYSTNPIAKVLVSQSPYGYDVNTVLGGPTNVGNVVTTINQQAIEPIFLGTTPAQPALEQAAKAVDQMLAKGQ